MHLVAKSGRGVTEVSTGLVLVLVVIALVVGGATRQLSSGHWLATAIFAVYLVGVAHFTLLPLRFDLDLAGVGDRIDLGRLVELRPFFLPGVDAMPTSQALLNILLTIPFGFGLPFVWRVGPITVIVVGVLFSLGIELTQLVVDALYLAMPTWSVDINDVLLNLTGVIVGYAVLRMLSPIYAGTIGHLPVRHGFWTHFHDVLSDTQPPSVGPARPHRFDRHA